MNNKSGNAALASDISVMLAEAFSEAFIVGIKCCEDMNDPLSLLQQRQMVSACMTVMMDVRDKIQCMLDLDDIARDCVGDIDLLTQLHDDIVVEMNNNEKVGFDD